MIQAKKRLGLFALCATAVLASTSLLVSAAQAAPPNWMAGGAELTQAKTIAAQLASEANLLTNVLKHMLRITCTQVTANAAIQPGGTGTGTLEFTSCETYYGGVENDVHKTPPEALPLVEACKPKEPIVAGGTGKLDLHPTLTPLVKLTGAPFATLDLGPECVAGQEFEVKGTVFVEDAGGSKNLENEGVTHGFKEAATATLVLGGLTFGAKAASIDGTVNVNLTSGEKWSGLPL